MNSSWPTQTHQDFANLLRREMRSLHSIESRQVMRRLFSPSLSYGRHFGPPEPTAKQAAVMIMLELTESGWSIPLTERPTHLPDHPGQISLPGGRLEPGESFGEAACREFSEELGTAGFPGEVVGELQPIYIYNSDYFVHAFVAISHSPISYTPCQREVSRVIHLPVAHLLDETQLGQKDFHRGKATWNARTILCEDVLIWGATAIMLGEFAQIYSHCIARS